MQEDAFGGLGELRGEEEFPLLDGEDDCLDELLDDLLEAGDVLPLRRDGAAVHEVAGDRHLVLVQLHVARDADLAHELGPNSIEKVVMDFF